MFIQDGGKGGLINLIYNITTVVPLIMDPRDCDHTLFLHKSQLVSKVYYYY
jgi:hypothetical protein